VPYSQRNGVTVYYEVSGEGPPLVLLHATFFDRRLWMYQIARYSAHFRVVAVDLRGHGRSDKPETPFSLHDMLEDVAGVCAQERIDRAIFGGVSVGSGIALLLGLERPELVDALLLVSGSSRVAQGVMQPLVDRLRSEDVALMYRELIAPFFAPGFPQTPHGRWMFDLFAGAATALSGRALAEVLLARAGCEMFERLGGLVPPVLVVNGEHDSALAGGRETAASVPRGEHALIRGTGHCCTIEDPDAFDAAVWPYLRRIAG
jgi:3-oxoadipate enol-lactonase